MFFGQPVCNKFFIIVYATGSKSLKNIMKHKTDNGPVPEHMETVERGCHMDLCLRILRQQYNS